MINRVSSLLRRFWPILGSLYLVYLALQPPPGRYVGLAGLVLVLPLLVGWLAGILFGVGPWATPTEAESNAEATAELEDDLEPDAGEDLDA